MNIRSVKRTALLFLAAGVFCALPVSATPIGILNLDSCSSGVSVKATEISFITPCVEAGGGTTLVSSFGPIVAGDQGTINNLSDPFPPGFTFFSFNGGGLLFSPLSLGPGSGNDDCSISPCSIFPGSPFVVVGNGSTTVILAVHGLVFDATGISTFVGQFSANFAGVTPEQLQAEFLANGELSATTFSGSFVATPIPEPQTLAMAGLGLALLAIYRISRKRNVTRKAA